MGRVTIDTCALCGCPLSHWDGRNSTRKEYTRTEGLVIEIGFSRGGWGRRDLGSGGIKAKFSGEVCGECFDEAQTLLKPIDKFLRGERKQQEHNFSPVRDNEPPPEGRRTSLLRPLRALLPPMKT